MSFTISELKDSPYNKPIAIIKGLPKGEQKKYVYYKDYIPNLDDLSEKDKSLISGLEPIQLSELKKSLREQSEPDDDKLVKVYYEILNKLKESNNRLVLKGNQRLMPIPNQNKAERVYVCGISGSGKSYFSAEYIKNYLRLNKGNDFILTSQIETDAVLDKIQPTRISPEELLEDGVEIDDIKDSIWMFDDVYSIEDKKDRNQIVSVTDNLCELSRHYNTSLLITSHLISNGLISRRVLNEATKIVLFPKSNKRNINYFLEKYERFDRHLINRILNLNSRYVCIDKQNSHHIVLYEKGCFLI